MRHTIQSFCSTSLLYPYIDSYSTPPYAVFFLKEGKSHGTEAVGVFLDSNGKDQEGLHVSDQAVFIPYKPYPVIA